jgi:hypothetical protein
MRTHLSGAQSSAKPFRLLHRSGGSDWDRRLGRKESNVLTMGVEDEDTNLPEVEGRRGASGPPTIRIRARLLGAIRRVVIRDGGRSGSNTT